MRQLDTCLAAHPGPRIPYNLIVTVRRDLQGNSPTNPGGFNVVAVQVPPQMGVEVDPSGPVARCTQQLQGRPFPVSEDQAELTDEFQEVLTLFLPPPGPPGGPPSQPLPPHTEHP